MNDRKFNLNEYVSVQERIVQFWHDYPDGRIVTTLESPAENFKECRYRAAVYKDRTSRTTEPDATGYAFEIAGAGMANKTSHEENCETSAIGRALANLGYATSQHTRPSREEMAKVNREPVPLRAEPPPGPPHPLAEYIENDAKGRKVWSLPGDLLFYASPIRGSEHLFMSVHPCLIDGHQNKHWTARYDEGMGKSIPIFTHQTGNPQAPCVMGAEDDG